MHPEKLILVTLATLLLIFTAFVCLELITQNDDNVPNLNVIFITA